MNQHRRNHSGLRPLRLQHEILDACRSYIVPSLTDPCLETLEVSHVEVSGDLRNVAIYLMPPAGETPPPAAQVKEALERAVPFARRMLVESVSMKRAPIVRLVFLPTRVERMP